MQSKNNKLGETIFILGCNSFAGRCFVNKCLDEGLRVVGVSRSVAGHDIFNSHLQHRNCQDFSFYQCHLNQDIEKICSLLAKYRPQNIVDFAGQGMVAESWDDPVLWYQTNLLSKVQLHQYLKNCDWLQRYIRVSTPEVYGSTEQVADETLAFNPSTPYAVSHAAIDMSLLSFYKQYEFPVILTRFANFYGPAQQLYRIVPRTIIFARLGQRLQLHGGGKAIRSFIYGTDVAQALWQVIAKGRVGQTYHFSTDEFPSIFDVVQTIAEQMNLTMDDFVDVAPDRPGKDSQYLMSSDKAIAELDWRANVRLRDGIGDVIHWVDENIDNIKTLNLNYEHKI